ncbi:hypothetical protein INR49_020179, partial [Caranx melampygus]
MLQCCQTSQSAPTTTDSTITSKDFSPFPPLPGQDSPLSWDGKTFDELPILHIKATYNNTHIQLTDSVGQSMVRTSCGTEGFKNIKKSTPIAAQTAAISAAKKATAKGITFVRVVVKGLGPGRLVAELHVFLAAFLLGEQGAEGVEFGLGWVALASNVHLIVPTVDE